jgi:hypothetical protein
MLFSVTLCTTHSRISLYISNTLAEKYTFLAMKKMRISKGSDNGV